MTRRKKPAALVEVEERLARVRREKKKLELEEQILIAAKHYLELIFNNIEPHKVKGRVKKGE